MEDIGNLWEIPMMDFAERICTFWDFYKKFEAFFTVLGMEEKETLIVESELMESEESKVAPKIF